MAITVEYDSVCVPNSLKLRRAFALPIYAVSLILSFISDGFANLAVVIASDPH